MLVLLSSLVVVQVVVWYASRRAGRRPRGTFLLLQVALLVAFVAGGYAETRFALVRDGGRYARASLRGTIGTPEDFEPTGDPGLTALVEAARGTRGDLQPGAAGFEAWQVATRAALRANFGGELVGGDAPEWHELSEETLPDGIRRSFVTIAGFDGTPLPGYLLRPAGAGGAEPLPGVLVVPGHTGAYEEGISQTAGIVDSYQASAALEFARAGMVTLTVELRGFGYLGPRAGFEHRVVAHNALAAGSSYRGLAVRDLAGALGVLGALPEVDPERLAAAGVSLGGELAWTLAAVDTRISAVVVHGYGGRIGPKAGARGGKEDDQPHGCHVIPGHNDLVTWEDWAFLVWPRALQLVRGSREPDFSPEWNALLSAHWPKESGGLARPAGGHRFYVAEATPFLLQNLVP